jgi:hypothetical protein
MANQNANATKVITGKVRLSYANLFVPRAGKPGDEEKYSVCLLIPKSDKKTLMLIKAAIEAAKVAGVAKLGGKVPSNLKTPIHDGDVDKDLDESPEYAGCYFMNVSAKQKPAVVGTERDIEGKLIPITDPTEVYSGCYARVSVNLAAYNHPAGGKGIGAYLNNVQKMADGESLGGGRSRADDDFGDDSDDDNMLG